MPLVNIYLVLCDMIIHNIKDVAILCHLFMHYKLDIKKCINNLNAECIGIK